MAYKEQLHLFGVSWSIVFFFPTPREQDDLPFSRRSFILEFIEPRSGGGFFRLVCLDIFFGKFPKVLRFHRVHVPSAMGPFIVLNEIIEGWLDAGKGTYNLVRFDDD